MSYQPTGIMVDVVLSGQHSTSVKPLTGGAVTVLMSGQDASVTAQDGMTIGMELPGVQGPPGPVATSAGDDGAIQYNDGGQLAGAENFLYDKTSDKVTISGGALVINKGQFILSGSSEDGNAASFLVKDESATLINIDPQTKNITFSENAANNEYYIGIGHSHPEEKLHIKNGNLRIDGDVIVSGNMIPTEGSKFSLGSASHPFKDIYLAGDSVIFPSQGSKLTVGDNSITFKRNIYGEEEEELFKVKKVGDNTVISGINLVDSVIENTIVEPGSIEYGAIKSGGAFASKVIPQGSTDVFMYFGEDLGYTPRVVCTLISPQDTEDMYFFVIENIKTSGCDVFFSSSIESQGYEIQCFASPRTGEGYFSS